MSVCFTYENLCDCFSERIEKVFHSLLWCLKAIYVSTRNGETTIRDSSELRKLFCLFLKAVSYKFAEISSVTACNEFRIHVYFRSPAIGWLNDWCDSNFTSFNNTHVFIQLFVSNESLMLSSKSSKASGFKHKASHTSTLGINYFWQIYFKLKSHSHPPDKDSFSYMMNDPLVNECTLKQHYEVYFKKSEEKIRPDTQIQLSRYIFDFSPSEKFKGFFWSRY